MPDPRRSRAERDESGRPEQSVADRIDAFGGSWLAAIQAPVTLMLGAFKAKARGVAPADGAAPARPAIGLVP